MSLFNAFHFLISTFFLKKKGGRNGVSPQRALNGTHETYYYMTPAAFFDGDAKGKDPADTTKSVVWVLD